MARGGRGSHGRSFRGQNRRRGGQGRQQSSSFRSSRLRDVDDQSDNGQQHLDDLSDNDELQQHGASSGSEDEEHPTRQSYADLLQVLNAHRTISEPPRKKQRTEEIENGLKKRGVNTNEADMAAKVQLADIEGGDAGLEEVLENEESDVEANADSEDEDRVLQDPFEKHYAKVQQDALVEAISAVKAKKREPQNVKISEGLRKTSFLYPGHSNDGHVLKGVKGLHLKRRLLDNASRIVKRLSTEEKDLAQEIFTYRDVQFGHRTIDNAETLRDLASLHALNHVFKTRDRILKNNAKSSQQDGDNDESVRWRDQGFTRPKVLFIVPTKQACAKFADSITRISEADQQENKSRFVETFSREDDDSSWHNKPADFQELFGGNNEEDFRVGLKFTRKTIKFFSGFYNSDIIFGSALGLMKTITTGGGSSSKTKDTKKKSHDADFLSSVEIVVVDHAAAIQMQNWQHLEYIFSQLNLLPKDSHGCDFGRVRNWYLDGQAQYLRQTIVFTSHQTPEINSLFSQHAHNVQGLARYTPTYPGAILNIPLTLPHTPVQTFLRIDSGKPIATADLDSNTRFNYFTTTIVPQLVRTQKTISSSSSSSSPGGGGGVLIMIPTYADFTRVRNYLSTSGAATSLSFGSVSEYTPARDAARARSHFMNGRHSVLLYTERAHHHFRYRIKGVKRVFFYGVPENPLFWPEFLEMLVDHRELESGFRQSDVDDSKARGKNAVRALFSRWDALKLERIVGTGRVGRLVSDRGGVGGGDVFEFR